MVGKHQELLPSTLQHVHDVLSERDPARQRTANTNSLHSRLIHFLKGPHLHPLGVGGESG